MKNKPLQTSLYKKHNPQGALLVVQWTGLCLPVQGMQAQSLVRVGGSWDLTCLVLKDPKPKDRSNVVTDATKTLKMVRIKKTFK